jgi:hypothetical protein
VVISHLSPKLVSGMYGLFGLFNLRFEPLK